MADIQPPSPGGLDLMNLLLGKVLPAAAGAYIRNVTSRNKPFVRRLAEMVGGVVMVISVGDPVGAIMWSGGGFVASKLLGVEDLAGVISRAEVDRVAAFLVGLAGITIAEGVLNLARMWRDNPTVRFK